MTSALEKFSPTEPYCQPKHSPILQIFAVFLCSAWCFMSGKPYFKWMLSTSKVKSKLGSNPHPMVNTLARMTFLLEHNRQLSQQKRSTSDRLTLPSGSKDFAFTMLSLHQKPREPLSDFILRTRLSLERKFSNLRSRDLFLETSVWKAWLLNPD